MIRTTDDSGEVTKCPLNDYDEELAALKRATRAVDSRSFFDRPNVYRGAA